MKQPLDEHRYFYVDETGDPGFYAKGKKLIVGQEGCSRTFGLGFFRTADPAAIFGKTKVDLGLRICRQEFGLTCQPIARVDAKAQLDDESKKVTSMWWSNLES